MFIAPFYDDIKMLFTTNKKNAWLIEDDLKLVV